MKRGAGGLSGGDAMAKKKQPTTVLERRRSIRSQRGDRPGLKKVEIDLTKPTARKMLTALFPRPTTQAMLDATDETEKAALEYVQQRDAESVAKNSKEVAGNLLCNAIGSSLGIKGKGWKATWDMKGGNVDWDEVVKEMNIPSEVIDRHRKPAYRALDVRELAEDE